MTKQRTETSGLAKNGLWNLVGQVGPVPVAIIAIPILVRSIGTDRFGVLTLAWMLVGYFSLFDLGMGRALTQLIAARVGQQRTDGLGVLAWTGLLLTAMLGLVGGLALLLVAPRLAHTTLQIPAELETEALHSFYVLGLGIPFAVMTAGLRGILEALQRFDITNAIRVPMGILTYVAPLLVLPITNALPALIGALVFVRCISWALHLYFCLRCMPQLRHRPTLDRASLRILLGFGGWMTLSSIVSPVMAYFDRFLLGSIVTMTMVAYYTTPFELVAKLTMLPSAIAGVLFPAFAARHVADLAGTERLFLRSTKLLAFILMPVVFVVVTFAYELLEIWVGADFADHGTLALQWLAIGTFMNCLALVPFSLVQGMGRPRATALLHVVELPFYIVTLWLLAQWRGIDGAAMAWSIRVGVDALVLFIIAGSMLMARRRVLHSYIVATSLVVCTSLAASLLDGLLVRVVLAVVALATYAVVVWSRGLDNEERDFLLRSLRLRRDVPTS